ncbi:MAG: nucleoside hydrolase [Alphaproteobacteria bacterium]|nr:nucleoside hydrolase [Alphaproteobacteria bacterium]
MTSLPLIIDCDPGDDDAVAILMALSSKSLDVKGITTVAGNATVDQTFHNARGICTLANKDGVPVLKGCAHPLIRSPQYATYIHGSSGIDGAELPAPKGQLTDLHAVDFMAHTLASSEKKITLAATAALTNIAVLLIKYPYLAKKIDRIVWLGGSNGTGNVTLCAEFNAFSDPHAVQAILNTSIPFYVIPLNISHQVCTSPLFMQRLETRNTRLSRTIMNMLKHTEIYDREYYGLPGRAIHDACVIAFLMTPELFHFKTMTMAIQLEEGPHVGATYFSTLKAHMNDRASYLALDVNAPVVLEKIGDALCSYEDL